MGRKHPRGRVLRRSHGGAPGLGTRLAQRDPPAMWNPKRCRRDLWGPAALPGPRGSQGTMNNIHGKGGGWLGLFETRRGGFRRGCRWAHWFRCTTNTSNTPAEVVEMNYPLRIERYQRREAQEARAQPRWRRLTRNLDSSNRLSDAPHGRRARMPWGLAGGQSWRIGC
ncbi:MAG: hypothetical protein CM15mP45_03710 [Deltaproteobacteria bacterium]|nr:MAG: hypothetical protein CM15mP45_03710 [Deltaproteobacteria bacterium]